jgi:sulfate/thiosulfate transport system ATP-binding protein
VFVTHDQEEAIEVADTIVVLADGVVEQEGSPHEIYDNPANPFVMRFLGPVTQIDGNLVRPHDVELSTTAEPGTSPATVTRVVRLGFEVRVEMTLDGEAAWAQVTRGLAERLRLAAGDTVHIRPGPGARLLVAGS